MKKPTKNVPKFSSEAQERTFWESHDSSEFVDWSKARSVVLPNLKPTTKNNSVAQRTSSPAKTLIVTHKFSEIANDE